MGIWSIVAHRTDGRRRWKIGEDWVIESAHEIPAIAAESAGQQVLTVFGVPSRAAVDRHRDPLLRWERAATEPNAPAQQIRVPIVYVDSADLGPLRRVVAGATLAGCTVQVGSLLRVLARCRTAAEKTAKPRHRHDSVFHGVELAIDCGGLRARPTFTVETSTAARDNSGTRWPKVRTIDWQDIARAESELTAKSEAAWGVGRLHFQTESDGCMLEQFATWVRKKHGVEQLDIRFGPDAIVAEAKDVRFAQLALVAR